MKTNKPSSIPSLYCCSVPLKGRRAFRLAVSTGGREEQRRSGERRGKNGEDLFIEARRSGSGGGGASEFLIIATATSHLATGYTMATVALATAWSPSDTQAG